MSIGRWSKFVSDDKKKEPTGPQKGDLLTTEPKMIMVDGQEVLVEVKVYQGDKAPTPKVKAKGGKVRKGPQQIKLPKGVA